MYLPLNEVLKIPVFLLAEELPLIPKEELKELEQDLEMSGQKHPIVIWNGPDGPQLLDGRNRLMAFQGTNLTEIKIEYFDGDESEAADQVYSLNIPRRHLKVGQKAAFALAYLPYEEEKAKKRQLEALTRGRTGSQNEALIPPLAAESKKPRENEARNIVAQKMGIHGQRVSEAKNLSVNAEDLFEDMKKGKIEITTAVKALAVRNTARDTKINDLETQAYDLFTQYQQGKIDLDDAWIILRDRVAKKKREAQDRSEALYQIQVFAQSAETNLHEFNLKIVKLSEIQFIDEALILIDGIEGHLAVTRGSLKQAKLQLEAVDEN